MNEITITTTTAGRVTLPAFHAFNEGMEISTNMVLVYHEGDGHFALAFPSDRPDWATCWEGPYIQAHSGLGSWEEFPDASPIGWWEVEEFPFFPMLSGQTDSENEYADYVIVQQK